MESRNPQLASVRNSFFNESVGSQNTLLDMDSSDSINRLCHLASTKPHTIASHQAQSVIDDLEAILDNVERTATYRHVIKEPDQTYNNRRNSSKIHNQYGSQSAQSMKRIRRILLASQSVVLKEKGFYQGINGSDKFVESTTTSWSYETQNGMIVISTTTKHPHPQKGDRSKLLNNTNTQLCEDDTELFSGTIDFLIRTTTENAKFSVSFLQRVTCTGCSIASPILQFHCMIPDTSEVFNAIKVGDLAMLIELFEKKEVAITDCDIRGRSLLNVRLLGPTLSYSYCRPVTRLI